MKRYGNWRNNNHIVITYVSKKEAAEEMAREIEAMGKQAVAFHFYGILAVALLFYVVRMAAGSRAKGLKFPVA